MTVETLKLKGPDFIGIGMERAGSSWIFYMLASHPDVWVPPIKELHYFDTIDPQSAHFDWRFQKHLNIRLRGKLAPFLKKTEDRPQFFKNSYLDYLKWDCTYFKGDQDDSWYKSLFDPKFTNGRISGEITAAYSTLSEPVVAELAQSFPDTKIILSVRDPVARTKSSLLHHIRGVLKKPIEDCTERELLDWLNQPVVLERSRISKMLKIWRSYIDEDHLCLIDFSEISNNPDGLIEKLYSWMGLDTTFRPPQHLIGEKVFSFKTGKDELPKAVTDKLLTMHQQELETIKTLYPALAKNWENA